MEQMTDRHGHQSVHIFELAGNRQKRVITNLKVNDMSKTRFVAFATQKGGIGKSTITALVANYFHNVKVTMWRS